MACDQPPQLAIAHDGQRQGRAHAHVPKIDQVYRRQAAQHAVALVERVPVRQRGRHQRIHRGFDIGQHAQLVDQVELARLAGNVGRRKAQSQVFLPVARGGVLGHDLAAAVAQEAVDHHAVEPADFLDDLHALAHEGLEAFGAAQTGNHFPEIGKDLALPLCFVGADVHGQPFEHRHRAAPVTEALPTQARGLFLHGAGLLEARAPGQDGKMRGGQRRNIEHISGHVSGHVSARIAARHGGDPLGERPGEQHMGVLQSRPMAHDTRGDLDDAAARRVHDHHETVGLHRTQQMNRLLCAGLLQLHRNGVLMRTRTHAPRSLPDMPKPACPHRLHRD